MNIKTNTSMQKTRNTSVDILRGAAILLVVLGHTMTTCTSGSQSSFLFNIVWAIQMPLFFIISGYVARYGYSPKNGHLFCKLLLRKTFAYMTPWAVWTFLVRGLIFGRSSFMDIKYLAYHMDTGYWFLFSLWVTTLLFVSARYLAEKQTYDGNKDRIVVLTLLYCIFGFFVMAGIGFVCGMSFLSIKLTLYYLPFYISGYLYGVVRDRFMEKRSGTFAAGITVTACGLFFLFLINRFSVYELSENPADILLRVLISFIGCAFVCGLVGFQQCAVGKIGNFFVYVGNHSLEIYLTHYLLLSIIRLDYLPAFLSVSGMLLTAVNFMITMLLTLSVTALLNREPILKKVLYAK